MTWRISKSLKTLTSFDGLSPERKKQKAKRGLALGLILFILMNVIAFLL